MDRKQIRSVLGDHTVNNIEVAVARTLAHAGRADLDALLNLLMRLTVEVLLRSASDQTFESHVDQRLEELRAMAAESYHSGGHRPPDRTPL